MKILNSLSLAVLLAAVSLSASALPECRDADAKAASDAKALGFFRRQGEVFRPAKVLKLHLPSRTKEVASYIRVGEKHYSIFTLVNPDCEAHFIKRTRQGDWPG
ncbi:MAG TPA: hypothetical protein DEA26_02270 [Oceanospirillales bacterium]|nr:hypothetical protein [Oceanospirillaceae bacterium]HBS41478.1 hypothetical protein [Oceanospirillales bacterium]|tara:strand:+ start:4169 stop:4480 length:312 start_codon:yes stop_codon:yes gene_type:complete